MLLSDTEVHSLLERRLLLRDEFVILDFPIACPTSLVTLKISLTPAVTFG